MMDQQIFHRSGREIRQDEIVLVPLPDRLNNLPGGLGVSANQRIDPLPGFEIWIVIGAAFARGSVVLDPGISDFAAHAWIH